jgi:UDP-glucose 4-epimerase
VRVLDDLSTGRRENLGDLAVDLVEADVRDLDAVRRAVDGVQTVIHLAALPSVHRSVTDPLTSNDVNVGGTLNVLVAARDAGVRRVVYAASSSAYGDTEVLPKVETMPAAPRSPYAVNKHVGELYARVFTEVYGLETVSLRYFNVYGPRQDPTSAYSAVIPRFIQAMIAGNAPVIYGDGRQSRDFTYVGDAVEATWLACTAPAAVGRTINVATGTRVTLLQIVEAINTLLGTRIAPRHAEARPGDVRHSLADLTEARTRLGYQPSVELVDGLRRTVRWLRDPTAPAAPVAAAERRAR